MSDTITSRELQEAIISGEFTLDWNGHKFHLTHMEQNGQLINHIKERLDRTVGLMNGSNDGNWNTDGAIDNSRTTEEWDSSMRDMYRCMLERKFTDGGVVDGDEVFSRDMQCYLCDGYVYPVLDLKNKKLTYSHQHINDNYREYVDTGRCEYGDGGIDHLSATISVNSKLILSNHFEEEFEDSPKDKRYSSGWSLDSIKGQESITKHLDGQNCMFGQLTNTSATVYLSDDKKSILIGDEYYYDSEDDYEEIREHEGYTKVGSICCCVWRWMGTDLDTITSEKLDEFKEESPHRDVIELDVPKGDWKMEHYFEFPDNPNMKKGIWSKIELIETS